MIRVALGLLAVAAVIVAAIALQGEPGSVRAAWLGWEADTTAAAAVLIIGALALAATFFWRAVIWVLAAPGRAARAAAESRRRAGAEALTRGFVAAASGDGPEARRQAQRAAGLSEENARLVRVLAAQAAEAAGDRPGARAAYTAMTGFPDLRLAALRGMMQIAQAEGDTIAAQRHAADAYGLAKTAPWAWRALLDARLEAADWPGALTLVAGGLERKIVTPLVAERTRAALQTARAAELGQGAAAADLAGAAAKARPDFTPAAVLAARILGAQGRSARAAPLVEAAWKARPHPALWLAWRDLRTDETPPERAARLAAFAALAPGAREGRIVMVEQALIVGDAVAARRAAEALEGEAPTDRLAGLMARVAFAGERRDEARAWIARAAGAPPEADWSDIDPEGRAFAYSPADWGRLVRAYGETGELAHPRFDRREATLGDLPSIPAAYEESAPFVRAAENDEAFLTIIDDGDFAEALHPAAETGDAAPALGGEPRPR